MRKITAAMVMLVGVSVSPLLAQDQNTPHRSSADVEVPKGVTAPGSDNRLTEPANGAPATTAGPAALAGDGGCAGCGGPACHPQGCLLHKLFIWATYCPKERLGCCHSCCNSCQYKGVKPPYLFFLNPKCIEGNGLHPTFVNECFRGCNGCAAGAPGGHP